MSLSPDIVVGYVLLIFLLREKGIPFGVILSNSTSPLQSQLGSPNLQKIKKMGVQRGELVNQAHVCGPLNWQYILK